MSVCLASGFAAAGVAAGIKAAGSLDVALVVGGPRTVGAAVFTTNAAAAAPVRLSRKHLAATRNVRAVVLNSGGANAATGERGAATALAMAASAADAVQCDVPQVLVCSTGTIGSFLPEAAVLSGIAASGSQLATTAEAATAAATAIMTTDSVPKQAAYRSEAGWSIGGMAKGAGMIRPDMATMLALITSDAEVSPQQLDGALRAAVDQSFHELNVDGCPSTNDAVIALSSRESGVTPAQGEFEAGMAAVCRSLAEQIAADAEGASRVVVIHVVGAADDSTARRMGRAVADSALVRSAFYGGDPNWGRVVGALGVVTSGDVVNRVDIDFAGIAVARDGQAASYDESDLLDVLESGNFTVSINVGDGPGEAHVLTTDLSPEYVRFNGERS